MKKSFFILVLLLMKILFSSQVVRADDLQDKLSQMPPFTRGLTIKKQRILFNRWLVSILNGISKLLIL